MLQETWTELCAEGMALVMAVRPLSVCQRDAMPILVQMCVVTVGVLHVIPCPTLTSMSKVCKHER
jgi:hypothetical protein